MELVVPAVPVYQKERNEGLEELVNIELFSQTCTELEELVEMISQTCIEQPWQSAVA